jgi:hypothetical protein
MSPGLIDTTPWFSAASGRLSRKWKVAPFSSSLKVIVVGQPIALTELASTARTEKPTSTADAKRRLGFWKAFIGFSSVA